MTQILKAFKVGMPTTKSRISESATMQESLNKSEVEILSKSSKRTMSSLSRKKHSSHRIDIIVIYLSRRRSTNNVILYNSTTSTTCIKSIFYINPSSDRQGAAI